jgi:hypothetical protein
MCRLYLFNDFPVQRINLFVCALSLLYTCNFSFAVQIKKYLNFVLLYYIILYPKLRMGLNFVIILNNILLPTNFRKLKMSPVTAHF